MKGETYPTITKIQEAKMRATRAMNAVTIAEHLHSEGFKIERIDGEGVEVSHPQFQKNSHGLIGHLSVGRVQKAVEPLGRIVVEVRHTYAPDTIRVSAQY